MSPNIITLEVLKHIAKLARLEIPENLENQFLTQVESILEYFKILSQSNTQGVEPTYQVTGLTNVLRDDVIDTSRMFTQAESLANAPRSKNGYFVTTSVSKK